MRVRTLAAFVHTHTHVFAGIPIETYRFLLNKSGRISDEVLVMFFCYDDAKRALLFHGRLMNDERMISGERAGDAL